MISAITTVTFVVLTLVTAFLGVIMCLDRAKFVRALRRQTGVFPNFVRSGPSELLALIQIFFPVKLEAASGERTKALRDAAVTSTRYAMISLLITIIVPVILFKILESIGI